jgi:hypothetical protein
MVSFQLLSLQRCNHNHISLFQITLPVAKDKSPEEEDPTGVMEMLEQMALHKQANQTEGGVHVVMVTEPSNGLTGQVQSHVDAVIRSINAVVKAAAQPDGQPQRPQRPQRPEQHTPPRPETFQKLLPAPGPLPEDLQEVLNALDFIEANKDRALSDVDAVKYAVVHKWIHDYLGY